MDNQHSISPIPALASSKPVVPVVSSMDADFIPVYSVLLASLLAHAKTNICYDLILLTENVSPEALNELRIQARPFPHVHIRQVDMTGFQVPYLDKVIFRKPNFFRLAIPDLLQGYDRAIYLDADTVLLHDVAELFQVPRRGFAAAVPDIVMHAYTSNPRVTNPIFGEYGTVLNYWKQYCCLSQRAQEVYFNSGVMVLNLAEIRKASLPSTLSKLLHSKHFSYVDQDILNIAFDGNIQSLPFQWNFFPVLTTGMQYPKSLLAKRKEAAKDIHILHYVIKKPWTTAEYLPYEQYFWFYARKSLYYENFIVQKKDLQYEQQLYPRFKRYIRNTYVFKVFKKLYLGMYKLLQSK